MFVQWSVLFTARRSWVQYSGQDGVSVKIMHVLPVSEGPSEIDSQSNSPKIR